MGDAQFIEYNPVVDIGWASNLAKEEDGGVRFKGEGENIETLFESRGTAYR